MYDNRQLLRNSLTLSLSISLPSKDTNPNIRIKSRKSSYPPAKLKKLINECKGPSLENQLNVLNQRKFVDFITSSLFVFPQIPPLKEDNFSN